MQEIKAIVRASRIDRVLDALHACEHFPGVTLIPCEGENRGHGDGGKFIPPPLLRRPELVKIEIFCRDAQTPHLVSVIQHAARTGLPGDGIITVRDLVEAIRIRTGQRQEQAV